MLTSVANNFKLALRTIRELVLLPESGMSSDVFLLFMALEVAGLLGRRALTHSLLTAASWEVGGVPTAGMSVSAEVGPRGHRGPACLPLRDFPDM